MPLHLYIHKYVMYTFTDIYMPICIYKLSISLLSTWLIGPKEATYDFSSFFWWQRWDQWLKTHMLCVYVPKLINSFQTFFFCAIDLFRNAWVAIFNILVRVNFATAKSSDLCQKERSTGQIKSICKIWVRKKQCTDLCARQSPCSDCIPQSVFCFLTRDIHSVREALCRKRNDPFPYRDRNLQQTCNISLQGIHVWL